MKLNLFTQKFLHVFIIDKMGIENFYDDKIITARKIKENAIQYRGRMKMKRKRKKRTLHTYYIEFEGWVGMSLMSTT